MKAVRFHHHGPPEVLQYEDVPEPRLRGGHAIVRVRACALNHLDLWQRRGIPRVTIPLPHIPGSDVAGEVVETSEGAVAVGTRVMLQPGISCGRCAACRQGRDQLCNSYDVLGLLSDGGYAEFVSVPVENLVPLPDHVDDMDAAAFPLTFLTAAHMLGLASVAAGDVVLVLAGGSGVGQAAIQLARLAGARVFATAALQKTEQTVRLGAERVFDHYATDFARELRAATDGHGADIVIEHVGEATWDRSVRALARGGRLVTCGATTGATVSIDLRHLFARQLTLHGSYMGAKLELLAAATHFFEGRLRPVVDRVYPLKDAAEAHRRLESREQFGKIVLSPDR
ncbi:MAG: zinc-binding dehydrogenase [Acidobacteria bacterium]|nr:zinc-binding dehydrogenase [Acidobacteriota bacterium]MCA1649380.1 zinc-binding dehydrogenase [Acidobacteriota bacterium]